MIRKLSRAILPTLCLVVALSVFTPALKACVYASGYTSWIQNTDEYEEFYSNATASQNTDRPAEQDDENFLIKLLGTFIHFIGADAANDLSTDKINLTIDGVVLGRLAQPGGVSYTSFDLSAGNVYGTVGATVYTVFRGFAYSGMFLTFLYLLAKAMFSSAPKAREDLKQGVYTLAINYALIYLMPQITDIVIFLRDNLLFFVMQHLSNDVSILNAMDDLYMADKSLIKAIVYTATVFASLFYIKDYVSLAIQETVLFGFFCLFTVLGVFRKKYLADWCATFFSNLLVPLIDVVCLMLPYAAIRILDTGQSRMSFGGACVVVMMIWSARTVRKELLKLFGNLTNTSAGRGIAGLAHMAQMARMANMAARGRKNTGGAKGSMETYDEWTDEIERQKNSAVSMERQGNEIGGGPGNVLGDIGSYESQHDDTGTSAIHACDDFVEGQQYENEYGTPGSDTQEEPEPDTGQEVYSRVESDACPETPVEEPDRVPDEPESDIPMEIPDEVTMEEGRELAEPSVAARETYDGTGGGAPLPGTQEGDDTDAPDMTEFEKNRYNNLQQMDMAAESIQAAREDIDGWNSENAMLDSDLQDAHEDAFTATESDRQELARLGKDNAALDLLIQENDADGRQVSRLQEQNRELGKEIADERRLPKGTGVDANARIESLERQREENSRKAADIRSGMEKRGRDWAEQADEAENRRIAGFRERNLQIDREMNAIKQSGDTEGAAGMRMEELSREKAANERQMEHAQSRIDNRSEDPRREKARNVHDMSQAQARMDANKDALERRVEDINRRKAQNRQNIVDTQTRMGNMSAQLEERKRTEEQFANIAKSNGKDGRKYTSAKEMRLHVQQRNRRLDGLLAAAEKRGAISQEMLRDLSPEGAARVAEIQREAIRQSNLRHAMAKLAGGTAKAAAITAGAAIGSVAAMYGGEDASATGAMLGAMGAGGLVNIAAGTAGAVTKNREEILADLEAGKNRVHEMAMTIHKQEEIRPISQPASGKPSQRIGRAKPPHEQVYRETLEALERNGRSKPETPDGQAAHERVRDETMDAIRRRGGRSGS